MSKKMIKKVILALIGFAIIPIVDVAAADIPMVRIDGGSFLMGSPPEEAGRLANEGPRRHVTLSAFNMGIHPVTRAQWYEVMRTRPWGSAAANNHPVTHVSWYDAIVFANRLSIIRGLTPAYEIQAATGGEWTTHPDLWGAIPTSSNARWNAVRIVANSNGYRLPTEAQWEFAARAGTTTPWNTGTSITTAQANFNRAHGGGATTPVGQFPANAWGLHDMHGNVWEWVWDWFGTYPSEAQTNPLGASSGTGRVGRGGSWYASAEVLRSAQRLRGNPFDRGFTLGFRLVRP